MNRIVYIAGAATVALTITSGASIWPAVIAAGAVAVMSIRDARRMVAR